LRKTGVEPLPSLMTADAQAYPGSLPAPGSGRIELAQIPVPEGVPDEVCLERKSPGVPSSNC